MKLIKYLINNVFILLINRIYLRRFRRSVRLERDRYLFFFRNVNDNILILLNLRKFIRHESNLSDNIRSVVYSYFISYNILEIRINLRNSRYL